MLFLQVLPTFFVTNIVQFDFIYTLLNMSLIVVAKDSLVCINIWLSPFSTHKYETTVATGAVIASTYQIIIVVIALEQRVERKTAK